MSVYGRYFVLENCKPSDVFKSYVTQFDLACDRLAFLQLTFLNANYPDHITHNFILYLVSIVAWPVCCSFCCTVSIFYSFIFFLWVSALYYTRRDAGFGLFYLILKHFKDNNSTHHQYGFPLTMLTVPDIPNENGWLLVICRFSCVLF